MPLYKDGVKFDVKSEHLKQIKEIIGDKWPAILRFPAERFTKRPTTEDPNRVDHPSKALIPYTAIIEEGGSTVTYNYSLTAPKRNTAGEAEFYTNTPSYMEMHKSIMLNGKDLDLAYFLLCISPCNYEVKKTQSVYFVVNDKKAALKKVTEEAYQADVLASIFGSGKISSDDVIRYANSFNLTMEAGLSDAEYRLMLRDRVFQRQKETGDGFKTFLDLINSVERNQILEYMAKAKAVKLLEYMPQSKKWMLVDRDGKKVKELCGPAKGEEPEAALKRYMLSDVDIAQTIVDAVKEYELQVSVETV